MQFTRNVQSIVIKCNCTLFFKQMTQKFTFTLLFQEWKDPKRYFFQHKILMQIHVF